MSFKIQTLNSNKFQDLIVQRADIMMAQIMSTPRSTSIQLGKTPLNQIEPLVAAHKVVVVALNDIHSGDNDKFKALIRAIIKHRIRAMFMVNGYDEDPRELYQIAHARNLFNIGPLQYGLLGIINDQYKWGNVSSEEMNKELEGYIVCCIGVNSHPIGDGLTHFQYDVNEKEKLVNASLKVYRDLYIDILQ